MGGGGLLTFLNGTMRLEEKGRGFREMLLEGVRVGGSGAT